MKTRLGILMVSAALSGPVLGQTWTYIDRLTPEDASADGTVIVGSSFGGSARWTAAGGMQVFGTEPQFGSSNRAQAVTADGTKIFGSSSYPGGGRIDRMYRWTGPGTFQGLGIFGAAEQIKPNAASADGLTVVATASAGQGGLYQGCIWTAQSGFRSIPGVGSYSTAVAVTADGSKIAGSRRTPNDRTEAYVWSADSGITVLRAVNGPTSQAYDMTPDGRFVVGISDDGDSGRATVWSDGVARSLGALDNFESSWASSVSDDGSIVTGYCVGLTGPADPNLNEFVWTSAWGILEVHDFLGRYGIQISQGLYVDRVKVTGDGQTIYAFVYDGVNSRGTFVATIPSPCTLAFASVLAFAPRRRH